MIAEDSELVRNTLKDMLEISKHQVVAEAVDGIDALEKFNSAKPDILFLDIAMPKKDGIETLTQIMKNKPDAKIIMITAHYNMELIENCIRNGALAYISKPFSMDDILHSISYALDEKLNLHQGASKTDVEKSMKNHILAETKLTGRYSP